MDDMLPVNEATAAAVLDAIEQAHQTERAVADGARIGWRSWRRRIEGSIPFRTNELSRIATFLGIRITSIAEMITEKLR